MTQRHAVITDEMLAIVRGRLGQERQAPLWNTEATLDAIRHFCEGIGDANPLFRDEEYARKTRYGTIVAPPCFLYSVHWPSGEGGGLPGIHAWHSGNDWEFYRPIFLGDRFTV